MDFRRRGASGEGGLIEPAMLEQGRESRLQEGAWGGNKPVLAVSILERGGNDEESVRCHT